MTGTVKFFDQTKRWGFIAGDDNADIFVHESNVPLEQRPLGPGDRVTYEVGDSPKGKTATGVNVTRRATKEKGGSATGKQRKN